MVRAPGGPEQLQVDQLPDPEPGAGELLVEVAAAGVNRADVLQRQGHYPPPPGAPDWPGMEISGVVSALGPGTSGWSVGDRVAALLAGGGYAERAVATAALCLPVPDGLGTAEAAALPEALATVWSTLQAARLADGDTLLVRGGSGGVGSVAVQVGHALGHRVLATAGGPERCERVRALGAEVVVDHRLPAVAERVLAATEGRGVDVVLDVLGAGGLAENLAMLAEGGRLAVIGLQQGRRAELDLGLLLERRATVLGTTLRSRPLAQKAAIMAEVRRHLWSLVAAGAVRPVVHTQVPFAQAAHAHQLMESGAAFGKILLVP